MTVQRLAEGVYRSGWLAFGQALLLILPAPFLSVGFFLVPLFYLSRWLAFGRWIPETRVNTLVLLLLAMAAIGFGISSARDLGIFTLATALAGVTLFFYLVDRVQTPSGFLVVTRSLAIIGLAIALGTPFKTEPSPTPLLGPITLAIFSAAPRLFSLSNPNIVAGGLAILSPFALATMVPRNWWWRLVGGVAFAVMALAILLLDSRGAILALGLGVTVWATLYRRWVLPLIPLGLIAFLVLNQSLQGPSISDLVYGQVASSKSGTFAERQEMWVQAVQMIRASPIFGIGLGAYPRIAPLAPPHSPEKPGIALNHSHNTFFQVALDTGVPGAVAFIALLISGVYFAWRSYRAGVERDASIALLAAFGGLVAHGLGDTVVWGTARTGLIFWVLMSLAVGIQNSTNASARLNE